MFLLPPLHRTLVPLCGRPAAFRKDDVPVKRDSGAAAGGAATATCEGPSHGGLVGSTAAFQTNLIVVVEISASSVE